MSDLSPDSVSSHSEETAKSIVPLTSKSVSIFLLFFSILLVGSFIFVSYLFVSYRDRVVQEKIATSSIGNELNRLKKYEENELKNYGYIDKEKGLIRIPISEAIKKVEKRYNNR